MSHKSNISALIDEVDANLDYYRGNYEGLSWREKVLLLAEISTSVKKLGTLTNPTAAKVRSRERIRLYLVEHVEIVIGAIELEVVSGISEYGRRVRELRVQDGYKVLTGHSNDPESGITLKPSEYLLLDSEPDVSAARRWHLANRIRREAKGGSSGRLLRYLQANVGQVVTNEELAYVARAKEFGRRVRELRTEQGFAIATRFTGRPDLRMGEYVLESAQRVAEAHDRKVAFEVQKNVYERARNTCQLCGWNRDRWNKNDPRILELHHVQEHAAGGSNKEDNLIVLCSKCHDKVHSGRCELPPNILGQ